MSVQAAHLYGFPGADMIVQDEGRRASGVTGLRRAGRLDVEGGTCMQFHRLYSGDDGESHMEEMDLADHPELTDLHGATGIVFKSYAADYFSDFHTAPRRQYVINIAGEVEIELGDGSVHRFGPGHVMLAEDLTGRGHITRVAGGKPRITAQVPLAE
jgi:hypothetical protein